MKIDLTGPTPEVLEQLVQFTPPPSSSSSRDLEAMHPQWRRCRHQIQLDLCNESLRSRL